MFSELPTYVARARLPSNHNAGHNPPKSCRPGSSENMWPWSFTKCNRDIQKQQQISGCNSVNHYDLYEHQGVDFRTDFVKYLFLIGRGAPEIDILEAMPGKGYVSHTSFTMPYLSTSLQVKQSLFNIFFKCISFQVSPGIQRYRPSEGHWPDKERHQIW